MSKKFLLAYLLFAAGTVLSANGDGTNESLWHTEAALGITVPLKQIYVGQKESKGFSVQLEGLYRARMDNGLSLFAGAAAGPFISEGFKVNDTHGICVNVNFWGGAGYDFLKKSQRQSLVLSGSYNSEKTVSSCKVPSSTCLALRTSSSKGFSMVGYLVEMIHPNLF